MTSRGLGALQSLGGGNGSVVIRGRRAPIGKKGFYITLRDGRFSYSSKLTDSTGEQLRPLQIEAVLAELQRRQARGSWFKLYAWAAGIFSLFLCFGSFGAGLTTALLFSAPGFFIRRWDRARRAIRLYYDLDSPELIERFSQVNAVGQWLGWSKVIWLGSHGRFARREFVTARHSSVAGIELNLEPWTILSGTRLLVPLPDHLLVLQKRQLFAVPYERMGATSSSLQVTESGPVPSDGRKIATTWRHTRRDGGPDLRFSNNPSSSVMLYGTLELSTANGPLCSLVLSNAAAAEGAARALAALSGQAVESGAARSGRAAGQAPMSAPPSYQLPPIAPLPVLRGSDQRASALAPSHQLPPIAPVPVLRGPAQGASSKSRPPVSPYSTSGSGQPVHPVPLVYGRIAPEEVGAYHVPPPPGRRQPAPVRSADQTWVPWDRSVELAGLNLGGGLYFGGGLRAINTGDVEPALIDEELPLDLAVRDCTVRRLDYWPSYTSASPQARAAYLRWLSTGRCDPAADPGYVFLYFYGLERRALADADSSNAGRSEIPMIVREVERLLGIYSHSGSFRSYASSFLGFIAAQHKEERLYEREAPPISGERELSLHHRLALAQAARDGAALNADWAYAWFVGSADCILRTAARRCPVEFELLFRSQYREKFGAGMRVTPNKTRLKIEHRAASRTFLNQNTFRVELDLPDVSILSAPVKRLQEVADRACEQLDRYSRTLGKDPDLAATFDAVVELPVCAWPDDYRAVVDELGGVLANSSGVVTMPFGNLCQRFNGWTPRSKQKLERFAEAISAAGLGIEPDARFGAGLPSVDEPVAVFVEKTPLTAVSAAYQAAAVVLQLGAAVANADGVVTVEERAALAGRVESWPGLSVAERRRLHARAEVFLLESPKLTGLKKRLASFQPTERQAIGDFLASIAAADSHIDPSEIKMLEKIYGLLDLDVGGLYSKAHAAAALSSNTPPPPKASQSTTRVAGNRPQLSHGINLDLEKVKALQADTDRVSGILGAIFTTEEEQAPPGLTDVLAEADTSLEPAPAAVLPGLDAAHSAFARALMTRSFWARSELLELSAERGVLLDGALERINEAALDQLALPFCEGDDPIEISQDVVKELRNVDHQAA